MSLRPRAYCCITLTVCAVAAAISATALGQSAPSVVDALVASHARGEPVLSQRVRTEAALLGFRAELFAKAREWRETWNPAGVAFLLDLSLWSLGGSWTDRFLLLRTAEEIVTGRERPPGAGPDRFELLFHRAALAGLISTRELTQAEDYFVRLDTRLAELWPGVSPATRLADPHLALLRGLLDEAWTGPGVRFGGDAAPSSFVVDPGDRSGRLKLQKALAAFDRAALFPEVADEAAVRRAFVLHRLGRHAEALAGLERADNPAGDRAVRYWRQLFRGRVSEALGRMPDARAAYLEAASIAPGTQTPAVALAALMQRHGDAAQARRWAAQARMTNPGVLDPWWQYWFGDLRWLPTWIEELRRGAS